MERYTKRLEDGQAVMDCANCSESWNTNPDGKCTALYCRNRLKDRLAAIEDILGDEYDLDRLRELAQADQERRCVMLPVKEPLKKGASVWYVDTDTGEIEEGEVFSVDYKGKHLDSFSVDFKASNDFDEFLGSAWGDCFFGSKEQAEDALRREQK